MIDVPVVVAASTSADPSGIVDSVTVMPVRLLLSASVMVASASAIVTAPLPSVKVRLKLDPLAPEELLASRSTMGGAA